MFAISPTDIDWFTFLRGEGITSNVNFWTPTDWKVKRLKSGDKLYFMLKSPIRKIGGYGSFREYKTISTVSAWDEFGLNNGCATKQEMIDKLDKYKSKNSVDEVSVEKSVIGAIVLDDLVLFDDHEFLEIEDYGVDFPKNIVKIKYFEDSDPFSFLEDRLMNDFDPLEKDFKRIKKTRAISEREGQSEFKKKISIAYRHCCCISGETTQELLEAAHIQPYQSRQSNHVQNGLLLRVDFHKLYDKGLLYIDEEYRIHISNYVSSQSYNVFHGSKITLPEHPNHHPSKVALTARKDDYRGKIK